MTSICERLMAVTAVVCVGLVAMSLTADAQVWDPLYLGSQLDYLSTWTDIDRVQSRYWDTHAYPNPTYLWGSDLSTSSFKPIADANLSMSRNLSHGGSYVGNLAETGSMGQLELEHWSQHPLLNDLGDTRQVQIDNLDRMNLQGLRVGTNVVAPLTTTSPLLSMSPYSRVAQDVGWTTIQQDVLPMGVRYWESYTCHGDLGALNQMDISLSSLPNGEYTTPHSTFRSSSLPNLYVDNYIKQKVSRVPDPMNTWLEQKMGDDIKRGVRIGATIVSPALWPSYPAAILAAGAVAAEVQDSRNAADVFALGSLISSSTMPAMLCNAANLLAGRTFLSSRFDPYSPVVESATIPLSHSWNDGFTRTDLTGKIEVVKTFKPDPRLFHSSSILPGTYHREVRTEYRVHETTGFDNWRNRMPAQVYQQPSAIRPSSVPSLNDFEMLSHTYSPPGSYEPSVADFNALNQVYELPSPTTYQLPPMPSVPSYTPPSQIYMPPPIYTPPLSFPRFNY